MMSRTRGASRGSCSVAGHERGGVARVWSEYRCDGVPTRHEWSVPTVQEPTGLGYDSAITVTNESGTALAEYEQFFACYTSAPST